MVFLIKKNLFILIIVFFAASNLTLQAQQEQPPKGIIVVRGGLRQFMDQTQKYNDSGELEGLGDAFYTKINLYDFLSDAVDKDDAPSYLKILKTLGNIGIIKSLLNQDLGEITGDVNAKIQAKYFALAYGINNNITLVVAPTWIKANVDVDVTYSENKDIKKPLGGLIANYITNNFDSILESYLTGLDYEPLDTWEYSGMGDTRVSLMVGREYGISVKNLRSIQLFDLQLSIPTGYKEVPEILNDVTLERGYYNLSLRFLQKIVYKRRFWVDGSIKFGYSFPTTKDVRVPEEGSDELMLSADRQVSADWNPGHEIEFMGDISGFLFRCIKPRLSLGYRQHFEDSYSGDMEGNWDKLSEGTASNQLFTEVSVGIDTSWLYELKKFLIPFMIDISYHHPIKAKNTNDERYFELTAQSFIPTPWYPKKVF